MKFAPFPRLQREAWIVRSASPPEPYKLKVRRKRTSRANSLWARQISMGPFRASGPIVSAKIDCRSRGRPQLTAKRAKQDP
jgi:hypothetical protein